MEYLVYKDGQQSGPFSSEQIREFLSSGQFALTDLCWYEGQAEWAPLSSIPDFRRIAPPPPVHLIAPAKVAGNELPPKKGLHPMRAYGVPGGIVLILLICGYLIFGGTKEAYVPRSAFESVQAQPASPVNVTGELTRDLATKILNKSFTKPSISRIGFRDGGFVQAIKNGLIVQNTNSPGTFTFGPPHYSFSDKDLSSIGKISTEGKFMVNQTPIIELDSPISQSVTNITGIALSPLPNIVEVDYVSEYSIPQRLQVFTPYLFTGEQGKAMFQKFDDGWRFMPN